MTLGERIKFIQQKSGLTLPVFAMQLGVSRESLINYQKDRTKPDSAFLSTLCKIFRVTATWLLMGEGEPFIPAGGEAKTPEEGQVAHIDSALRLVEAAIQETGIPVSEIQKQHLVGIIQEEMKILAGQVVRALKRGNDPGIQPLTGKKFV